MIMAKGRLLYAYVTGLCLVLATKHSKLTVIP